MKMTEFPQIFVAVGEKQGFETLVFSFLQACEVVAQKKSNQRPSRLLRGTVTNRVFLIFQAG